MWKLLRRGNSNLFMARKGDCFLKFATGHSSSSALTVNRLLDVSQVRVSNNPLKWETEKRKYWTDTGHDCETLKEMHDLVHMVQLMED